LFAGKSFMALSKTLGKSYAPGGCWCLLGLPCGVCGGLVKCDREGVEGSYSFSERVSSGGGGIGSLKSPFS
jgi:hypothetical protein